MVYISSQNIGFRCLQILANLNCVKTSVKFEFPNIFGAFFKIKLMLDYDMSILVN